MRGWAAAVVALAIAVVPATAALAVPAGPAPVGPAPAATAPAARADDLDLTTAPDAPWFGGILDWTADDARSYADRLGATPAVLGQSVRYPLSSDDVTYLDQFAQQAAQQGSLLFLTLEPSVPLGELTAADATALTDRLEALRERYDSRALVRFAPEMNGSWTPWGQQPSAYVQAFRQVADAVHASDAGAVTVWSPAYAAGYPFGAADGLTDASGTRPIAELDTDGNGRVDADDDAYRPYYPGDEAVDWVGLSASHFGAEEDFVEGPSTEDYLGSEVVPQQEFGENVVPEEGKYLRELAGDYGYPDDSGAGRDFAAEWIDGTGKPAVIETGALYDPARDDGAGEAEIKSAWWEQVLAADVRAAHPGIGMVVWRELEREEAEADGALIDWRATGDPAIASALRADLDPATATLGPVTEVFDQERANVATAQYRDPGSPQDEQMGWIVLCAVVLLVLFLASGILGRLKPGWRYPDEDSPRDRRLDLFRGWTIVAVVITHIEIASPYSFVTINAIGAITGAEMFVLLSGLVLGMVYPMAVKRFGEMKALVSILRRAFKQYVVAIAVVVIVFALTFVPFLATDVITTFTDRGTGADGEVASGQVYDLYPNGDRLLDYPPPWYAIRDLLLLRMGPWVFNIMGLFVVLTLLVPAVVWLLRRRMWWVVLIVSWTAYVLNALYDIRVLPSMFEDVFPLLTWQVAFLNGMVIGYYRRRITRALTGRLGRVLVTIGLVAYVGSLAVLWAGHTYGVQLPGVPEGLYSSLYGSLYQRTFLQPGRLLDLALMLVVAYTFLTRVWKPVDRAFGWFYTPLGSASLYVFIVHVFFVLLVGSLPFLDRANPWQGAVVHTLVLAAIWFMVTRKVLFKVIPT
ncbi:OpgC domain-containing protein [Clavibacter sp. km3a]|uniref:OpgC domain-containing protein n=1 Tax=Clavibacter sp. km3a TaxID=3459135 RepID=UPI004042A443